MQCPFELYILNLPESRDRMRKITKDLRGSPAVRVKRVEAVRGTNLSHRQAAQFLNGYSHLKGAFMHSQDFKQKWVYDGTLDTAFPGLNRLGHDGDKGLTLSNLRAMKAALAWEQPEQWVCIAEDDAHLPPEVIREVVRVVNATTDHDILWFDSRGLGGAALVCYRKSILPQVLKHMHPLSDFSRSYEARSGRANLWDWQLGSYARLNHRLKVHPLVKSGAFESTISPG